MDVISKDIKDSTKNARKAKELSSSRRLSSQLPPPLTTLAAPRTSMGEVRPPSQVAKRTGTPESKTITRKRISGSYTRPSSDEQQQHPHKMTHEPGTPHSSVQKVNNVLRSKNIVNSTSVLPKYRPKTNGNDLPAQKPPSPVKVGTRRRLSSSEDERKEQNFAISPVDKSSRPISPLPYRAALKTNVNSINVTPPVTPSKPKTILSPPSGSKLSPTRPTKIIKTTTIPRPPSSTSSVSSLQPSTTPKSTRIVTPIVSESKSKFGFPKSKTNVKSSGGTPSKLVHSTFIRDSPSPLSRRSGQSSKSTPSSSMISSGNMSHISEGACESEDSDLDDVELLLAPVAAIGAPTPAMPRIRALKKREYPQTPTKSRLPSRENLSYVSPDPPRSDKKDSLLSPFVRPSNSEAPRGSILSWEQLAAEASRTMSEDEFGRMLADVPAPFHSGAGSPALSSHLGLPDSPGLSVIDSPGGGYGSISQVLLPDVTPSPAVNHSVHQNKFHLTPDASKSAVDSSTATLLRLQLASMESTAKERLKQMQAMEEEMYNVKQAHAQQMEEMQKQIYYMESQSRLNDERVSNAFNASLDEQLSQQRIAQEEMFRRTISQLQDNSKLMHDRALDSERAKMTAASSARLAASQWDTVTSVCEAELDHVRADRAMLAFLLSQVDQMSFGLRS